MFAGQWSVILWELFFDCLISLSPTYYTYCRFSTDFVKTRRNVTGKYDKLYEHDLTAINLGNWPWNLQTFEVIRLMVKVYRLDKGKILIIIISLFNILRLSNLYTLTIKRMTSNVCKFQGQLPRLIAVRSCSYNLLYLPVRFIRVLTKSDENLQLDQFGRWYDLDMTLTQYWYDPYYAVNMTLICGLYVCPEVRSVWSRFLLSTGSLVDKGKKWSMEHGS